MLDNRLPRYYTLIMNDTRFKLTSEPALAKLIRAAFPSYKKREAVISAFPETCGMNINSYWDGGSRDEYAIVELATGALRPLPTRTHPFFEVAAKGLANQENEVVSIDHVGNVTLKILPEG